MGILWVYEDGVSSYYSLIDEDDKINKINDQIEDLYNSYFEFNSHDQPIWFNEEKEKETKDKMLFLLKELNDRLNEINDGSFTIEDRETKRLNNL